MSAEAHTRERCGASISGTCLELTEGFAPCPGDECWRGDEPEDECDGGDLDPS